MKAIYAEPVFGAVIGEVRLRTHDKDKCDGEYCVVHNPSDHHMRDWPLVWRADKGVFERTCPHGVGHPDPDDAAYHTRQGRGMLNVHGCDWCCVRYVVGMEVDEVDLASLPDRTILMTDYGEAAQIENGLLHYPGDENSPLVQHVHGKFTILHLPEEK